MKDPVDDGFTTDISGYNNHCELKGGMSGTNATTGIMRQALKFDGTDDYLDCGESGSLDVADVITIEAWVKRIGTISIGTFPQIVSKKKDWGGAYALRINFEGKIELAGYFGGSDGLEPGFSSVGFPAEKWSHVAATFDGYVIKYYIDGKDAGDADPPDGKIGINDAPLYIGTSSELPFEFFEGIIDEVRIYSAALTAGEIQKHYAEGLERYKLAEK